ncbi:septal ring lytic transglycosylase RlpA family protein [Rhizobium sp. RU36D]|uniref:septal ring lytic transglycosylase RlpA family protein n=1 Tax=Rhizobium sp. RU36D TaxID=1907415 RepID=UPI0009FD7F56|nr:septal ring lytic transglycosylase RlpA family protein [Rhizobium sp. RU36D]
MKLLNCAPAMGMAAKWLALSLLCVGVASCATSGGNGKKRTNKSKEYFAESEYGVKASPRLVHSGPVPKGGGRYMVGRPYTVKGQVYVPKDNPNYDKVGIASWYGSAFHGRQTANGELYDQYHLSAAHPTLPLPSYARVTNLENGSSVIVRVNDRGPFHAGRIIDLSNKTADLLDMSHSGTGKVRVQYVGPARMDGHDMPFLMASFSQKGDRFPRINPEGQIASGVMVASAEPMAAPQSQPQTLRVPPPAPAIQTSLSGPTPNGSFDTTAPAAAALEQFLMLPQYGPHLIERPLPSSAPKLRGSFASAYAVVGSNDSAMVFDAILVRNDGLTPEAIEAFAARRAGTQSKP